MWQCTRNLTDCAPVWRQRLTMMLVLCLLSMGAVRVAMGAAARQKSFSAPEEGVRALIEAAQKTTRQPCWRSSGQRRNPSCTPATQSPIGRAVSIS